ncbi:MAG: tRNA lysidine(34) synthetase TilS [Spirochaetales bacterium]|nr:tRNA lysidine(34) synthetase TilS [Spirochaetales bacterium]
MRSTKETIETSVKNFLDKNEIKNCSIVIAFSGGPDSTVLLKVLTSLKEYKLNIYTAYFNHGIRDSLELEKEIKLVKESSESFGVKCFIGTALQGEIEEYSNKNKLSIEEGAREYRYTFLEKIKAETNSDFIATAHNVNDNVETMIMRFFSNSGVQGLSGIPEIRNDIIRPLHKVERKNIEDYIKELNLKTSTDKTNLENNYLRNKIRNILIPQIKEIFPEMINNVDNLSSKIKDINNYIDAQEQVVLNWEKTEHGFKILQEDFYSADSVLRKRSVLKKINLISEEKRINNNAIEQITESDFCGNGKILFKSLDANVFTANNYIFIESLVTHDKKSYLLTLKEGGQIKVDEAVFYLQKSNSLNNSKGKTNCIFKAKDDGTLLLRTIRPGDSIKTNCGTKSLKKLFSDWKIKNIDKERIPIVEDSEQIRAVLGKHLGYENKIADSYGDDLKDFILTVSKITENIGE